MAYPEFEGGGGMGELFLYAKEIIPIYDSLLFGVILIVLTFTIYFIQESKRGKGDFAVAFAVGSLATSVLAIILSLLSGFTSGNVVGVYVAITMVAFIILFYSEP